MVKMFIVYSSKYFDYEQNNQKLHFDGEINNARFKNVMN